MISLNEIADLKNDLLIVCDYLYEAAELEIERNWRKMVKPLLWNPKYRDLSGTQLTLAINKILMLSRTILEKRDGHF